MYIIFCIDGSGCADPRYPGVYTEVSYHVNWIDDNIVLINNPNKID